MWQARVDCRPATGGSHQEPILAQLTQFLDALANRASVLPVHNRQPNLLKGLRSENLSFGGRLGLSSLSGGSFLQPVALFGPGFGPPVGLPFTAQIGARVEF